MAFNEVAANLALRWPRVRGRGWTCIDDRDTLGQPIRNTTYEPFVKPEGVFDGRVEQNGLRSQIAIDLDQQSLRIN